MKKPVRMTVSCYGKGAHEPTAQTARAYPSFICMDKTEAMFKSITIPQTVCRRYPLVHLGEKIQSGAKFLASGNNATGEA